MKENDPDNRYSQRLGQHMVVIAWVLLLALLSWFFSNYLERQHNPNATVMSFSNSGHEEVVLERNRYGHYVAGGRINGHPVTFMLDTGATMVSVPEQLARKLNLSPGPVLPVATANGTIEVYSATLDEVQLGGIVLTGIRAGINPYMTGEEVLLGMSFLKHLDFSQQDNQLTLRQLRSVPE